MPTASPFKDLSSRRAPVSTEFRDRVQVTLGDAFQIERELAPGGMSRLFLAAERSLDRRVVVKVLPELATEASAQRFQREMLVTAKLQHAHILPVLTAAARDGLLYYVTPFVAGESLRQRLTLHGALPIEDVVRVLREVVDALAFAHALGVVHRDLKPDNILMQHGHAILADFGIARVVEQATRSDAAGPLTEIGLAVGTPGYMAPEQLLGRHVAGRADGEADLRERAGGIAARRLSDHARDAEVGEDGVAVLHQDVVWLEIAMHDAERVREGERVDDLAKHAHHILDGERAVQRLSLIHISE